MDRGVRPGLAGLTVCPGGDPHPRRPCCGRGPGRGAAASGPDRAPRLGARLLRAAVAYSQIYINPATEAVYPVCETDHLGRSLTGAHNYSITFAPDDLPPAEHFWSLTMYHRRGLLCDNVIGRHAITDRTPGLEVNDDGTLALLLQHARPSSAANWLPCPPGEFRVMLRLYGPRDLSWSPPAIVRVG
ncbi:hypothetical protein CA982_18485 [Gordonia lacunae]|uniref:DUF1214 domain-containing protein n=1 Tax=Gordonia lacunae TaxID=417102 RepID=A0A243Q6U3_9ACTN|nr:hypothetical protein CA982_18485 [Gordonia lacunae]